MHLPPSRRIKGDEQLRRRNLPQRSPIKKSTQDHRGFLWTVAPALLLGPRPHERWRIVLIFRCSYNLEMCWCAELQEGGKKNKKSLNTHQRQVGNVPPPFWKPCRGCLWGIRGQSSSRLPLHTGLNCLWRLMILTTLRWVVTESHVARGRRLCDVSLIPAIWRIQRLSSTADWESKKMLQWWRQV